MHLCKIQNIYLIITIEIYSHMYYSLLTSVVAVLSFLFFWRIASNGKLMWEQPVIYLSLPSSVLNKCILWESQIILTFTKPLGFRENSLFIVLKLFCPITHMESKLVLKPKVKKKYWFTCKTKKQGEQDGQEIHGMTGQGLQLCQASYPISVPPFTFTFFHRRWSRDFQ